MIVGEFRRPFPRLTLALPGSDGATIEIEFVIDTGFEGCLSLPARLIQRLDLPEIGFFWNNTDLSRDVAALWEWFAVKRAVLVREQN